MWLFTMYVDSCVRTTNIYMNFLIHSGFSSCNLFWCAQCRQLLTKHKEVVIYYILRVY